MNKFCKLLCLFALMTPACSQEPGQQTSSWTVAASDEAPGSVDYAAGYIIYDLAQRSSPSVQAIRARCRDPKSYSNRCDDNGTSMEAIIGLLGAGGDATTQGLLKLMAIQLDAALAEERECQIGKRGKRLLPVLRSYDANRAAKWCQAEFDALRKRELSDVTDASVAEICRPADEIERDRRQWIKAFEAGEAGCGYE
jgi:hypothetical protein